MHIEALQGQTFKKMATAQTAKKFEKRDEAVQLAVIGGGPKAAAIAAKAWVLKEQNLADIHVTIFEPKRIGAYWAGGFGYTDGEQRLCTIAERDVGFPYNSMFKGSVDAIMSSKFSWTTFLQTLPEGYSEWVDTGRKPPSHRRFADYLTWVVDEAESQRTIVKKRVTALNVNAGRWEIVSAPAKGRKSTYSTLFDAVVVTGPGPAKEVTEEVAQGSRRPNKRIFNGQDFWQRLDEVEAFLDFARSEENFDDLGIVIIGAGGTAAAILSWLVSNGARDLPIEMVANQASLYTRVDSVFENRLFSDDTRWSKLSTASRRAFFDRLNRGVVWSTVMDNVASATNFTMVDGRAERLEISAGRMQLVVQHEADAEFIRPGMLIDCSGFDAWWFLDLLPAGTIPPPGYNGEAHRRDGWQSQIGENLQLQGALWSALPPLHAPGLARELGPGFGSLMVLGAMADRVLRHHKYEEDPQVLL